MIYIYIPKFPLEDEMRLDTLIQLNFNNNNFFLNDSNISRPEDRKSYQTNCASQQVSNLYSLKKKPLQAIHNLRQSYESPLQKKMVCFSDFLNKIIEET